MRIAERGHLGAKLFEFDRHSVLLSERRYSGDLEFCNERHYSGSAGHDFRFSFDCGVGIFGWLLQHVSAEVDFGDVKRDHECDRYEGRDAEPGWVGWDRAADFEQCGEHHDAGNSEHVCVVWSAGAVAVFRSLRPGGKY